MIWRKIGRYSFVGCLLLVAACAPNERKGYAPPSLIPGTTQEMKSPGFWVSQDPLADQVVLDKDGIAQFNAHIQKDLHLVTDVTALGDSYDGAKLRAELEKIFADLALEKLFDKNALRLKLQEIQAIRENINTAHIAPVVSVRYGFVRRDADQRLLPTDEIAVSKPGDVEFDELQNSSLDIGTPLAILHESKDGVWFYVHAPSSAGWVKKDRVVLCPRAELTSYLAQDLFVVVISPKADIFLDPGRTHYVDTVRMGTRFPCSVDTNAAAVEVLLPSLSEAGIFAWQKAYIKKEDVHFGSLSYTARHIIEQAFKLLNAPYGWGGVNGEQDCSSFLQEVFATVGIRLPRNSGEQGQVGEALSTFTDKTADDVKQKTLCALGFPGTTILQLKGHVLLYLGTYKNVPYAIHATYGYREKVWYGEILRKVNRVIVSDLSLGEGTKKGSLIKRSLSIRSMR
jgi:hypothetical protein